MGKDEETVYLFHFEAHSIQRYVFESGRLAEMVGASDLIEDLIGDVFELVAMEPPFRLGRDSERIIRRAGGALTISMPSEEEAHLFRDIWSLVVREVAPSLSFNLVVCRAASLTEALQKMRDRIAELRNQAVVELPVAAPIIARAPRTGNAAVKVVLVKADRRELVDKATVAKRQRRYRIGAALAKRFLGEPEQSSRFTFPRNMEADEENAFPFSSQNRYVAIVHIDGNGFGQHLIKMAKHRNDQKAIRQFSTLMTEANIAAAQEALRVTLLDRWGVNDSSKECMLPFRPLVLGGDDLTVIIGAEYALDFVEAFVRLFEEKTEEKFKQLTSGYKPRYLTACAGIAYVKSSQPFYLAYELAESLCDFAKKSARSVRDNEDEVIPSALAMHRITSSFISDYDTALNEELTAYSSYNGLSTTEDATTGQHPDAWQFTLGAYGLGKPHEKLPQLNQLRELVTIFEREELNKGPLRHFMTLLHSDPAEAQQAYKRWSANMAEQFPGSFDSFNEVIRKLYLGEQKPVDLPFVKVDTTRRYKTFIGDLLNLYAAQGEVHGR